MYGSEYFSNEFGLGDGNDLPCFFQIYEKIRQTHISLHHFEIEFYLKKKLV